MEVKNLDKYFSDRILRRGFDYFKANKVKVIYKSGSIYEALVKGTNEYKVTVDMTGDEYRLSCTCPYESHCKHEAAVLYCLKNDSVKVKEGTLKNEIKEITPLERFKNDLMNAIKNLNYEYSDYDNDYYDEYDYYNDNELEMTEEEEEAIFNDYINTIESYTKRSIKEANGDNKYLIDTFKILIVAIDNCSVNRYDYSSIGLYQTLFETYGPLLKDKELFARILSTLVDLRTKDEEYFYKYIDDAIYKSVSTKWQTEYVVNYFNDLENIFNKVIPEKIKISYEFLDKEQALKEAEKDKYLTNRTIMDWLLDIYKSNTKKQIELLEKYCDKEKYWKFNDYYEKLLKLYKATDIEKYKKALVLFLEKNPDYNTYLKVKQTLTSEEWNKIKINTLEKIKSSESLYCDICIEEKEYKRALEFLQKASLDFIINYIDELAKIYPNELLELYKKELFLFINEARNTSAYKMVTYYFNNLMRLPKGKEEILKFINYINVNFPNRRSFQTEMDFYKDTYL